jgi:hypothetical protein
MPKLVPDLEAKLIRHERRDGGNFIVNVETLAEAQGIRFLCPLCFAGHDDPVGVHSVICWSRSRGVPDDVSPGPGRWRLDGTGLHDLTLNADPPSDARSVQLNGGCGWHGHVTDGEAV